MGEQPKINDKFISSHWAEFIHDMFLNSFKKEWYETYWVIDVHNTIIKSTYKEGDDSIEYFPYAKETMQLLSERSDIITIMWTSSSEDVINSYDTQFTDDGIWFNKINHNDEISSKNGNFGSYDSKFYFNVLIDDKAAFKAERDWKPIYELLVEYNRIGFLPIKEWSTKK